ncbi:MAG: class I SAM-dependent methyltransferase [Deltaproteobacteria bacterium]|nr:class I SAM-dependent methyltransferase [Deltaproteobacteria bacterium]
MNLRQTLMGQFGHPAGPLGLLAGWIMLNRPSNRERILGTLERLDLKPDDSVLEVGFGPGWAIEQLAAKVPRGKIVGIDHSQLMVDWAARRNAQAIESGQVALLSGAIETQSGFPLMFNKVLAVNVFFFWDDPGLVLQIIRSAMQPGGTLALTFQPRKKGATMDDTRRGADQMAQALGAAGFSHIHTDYMATRPVEAACVLGKNP